MAEVCFSEFKHPVCVTEIFAKATGATVIDPMENFQVGLYRVLQVCSGAHPSNVQFDFGPEGYKKMWVCEQYVE